MEFAIRLVRLKLHLAFTTIIVCSFLSVLKVNAEEYQPQPAVGERFVPADVDWQDPIYEDSFDSAAKLKDWRLEGGKSVSMADGKLVLESHDEGPPAANKDHLVCWLNKKVPADFLLEFSLRPRARNDGLNIVIFNGRGVGGESVFDSSLPPRNGTFNQYHSGELKNYHISYWASTLEQGPRVDVNVRKNPGFHLVATGRDMVTPGPANAFQTVRLHKRGGVIRLMVDDVVSAVYVDDGKKNGPIWDHSGWLGLRQMGRTVRCEYDHIKVCALKPAAATLSASDAPGKTDWPPAFLKDLPEDYRIRQHKALDSLLAKERNDLNQDSKPVVWIRYGIAGLALGKDVRRINDYLERPEFQYSPNDKFGFSLFSMPFVRLYGLYNSRTGVMKGRLSPKAQENLEQTLWKCAKENSKIAEARRGPWDMEGSENHHMVSKVSDLLVAQYLKDVPAFADRKYDDGSTLHEQYEARTAYWHRWIDSRVRRGLFMEDGGSSYQNYTLEALLNLRDFAGDEALRRKGDMFLDLVYANIAEETLGVQRGGPKTRTKDESFRDTAYDLLFDAPGASFDSSEYTVSTSNYCPAPAVVELAKDFQNRGTYSFAKLAPGAVSPGTTENKTTPTVILKSKWRTMDRDNLMVRNGYATAQFIMGSHGLDAAAKTDPYRVQRWQGIVFANHPMAVIGMDGKDGKTKGPYISNPFKTIQDRNVMVTFRSGELADRHADPCLWIYFSSLLDAVEEKEGWIFVRSGKAFAAVKVVDGGYKWSRPWKRAETFAEAEKSFVRANLEDAPIITVANDAADYDDDFSAFQRAVIDQPVSWKEGLLNFSTITHEGVRKPGRIGGEPVDLRPARVNDSPFIRSRRDSAVVFIRKGEKTLKLDFSNPDASSRTIDGPPTSEFPRGIGDLAPLVFKE